MARAETQVSTGRRPNYLYLLLSVAIVLFLLGFFGLVILQAAHLTRTLKEQVNIIVELSEGNGAAAQAAVQQQLDTARYVRPGSVQVVSREDALREMSQEMGEDLARLDLPNPFYDMLVFNVKADYLQQDSLQQMRASLREVEGVSDVFYQESLVERVASNVRRLGWIALIAALILILISAVMIHNTVRLALYANRFVIKTQELVGATWGFITRPYLQQAVKNGLLSGLMATVGLVGVVVWLQIQTPQLALLDQPWRIGLLLLVLFVLGVGIMWVSTYYVVRRYLRLRVDDLY